MKQFKEHIWSLFGVDSPSTYINEELKNKTPGKIINAETSPLYKTRNAEDIVKHSAEEMQTALKNDKASVKVMNKGIAHKEGDYVGARLNLNVFRNTGIPVLTLHHGTEKQHASGTGFFRGDAEAYKHTATLKNVKFSVNQRAREDIASGKSPKTVMASVDGQYHDTDTHSFHGVEAKFNPKREHVFVDEHGRAVKGAEEVTLHGHKIYMRGKIEYHTHDTMPKRAGDAPSAYSIHESNESGHIVEDVDMYHVYFGEFFNEEIANVTGTPSSNTGGVSMPPTAKPNEKNKVTLFTKPEKRKETDGK